MTTRRGFSGFAGAALASTRALMCAVGPRVVVVRVFVKKTQKTPASEIALALARAKDLDT